ATGGRRQTRLRSALVVAEVSLACVLLVGAGAMLRSFSNLLRTDPGFRAEHVLTASVSLPGATYKDQDARAGFYQRLLANLAEMPGVEASGIGTDLPWTGYDDNTGGFEFEGKKPAPNQETHARYHTASPDFFRALGVPLVAGRYFNGGDVKGALPV